MRRYGVASRRDMREREMQRDRSSAMIIVARGTVQGARERVHHVLMAAAAQRIF